MIRGPVSEPRLDPLAYSPEIRVFCGAGDTENFGGTSF